MSHVTEVSTRIDDLEALDEAAKELGGRLNRGEKHARWWEGFVDDSTLWKSMFTPEEAARIAALPRDERIKVINAEMSNFDHTISFPGCQYDVGVKKAEDGTFKLRYDSYTTGGLENVIGKGGGKLTMHYGVKRAVKEARRKRLRTKQLVMSDGSIKLQVTEE